VNMIVQNEDGRLIATKNMQPVFDSQGTHVEGLGGIRLQKGLRFGKVPRCDIVQDSVVISFKLLVSGSRFTMDLRTKQQELLNGYPSYRRLQQLIKHSRPRIIQETRSFGNKRLFICLKELVINKMKERETRRKGRKFDQLIHHTDT